MKEVEFIACGLRVIGVWLLIGLFGDFAEAYSTYHQIVAEGLAEGAFIAQLIIFTPVVLAFSIAFLLLFVPVKITKLILPRSSTDNSKIELKNSTLSISLLTVLGFYTVSTGLADLALNGMLMINYDRHGMNESIEYGETIAYQVSTTVQLLVGVFLILGAKKQYMKIFNSNYVEINT